MIYGPGSKYGSKTEQQSTLKIGTTVPKNGVGICYFVNSFLNADQAIDCKHIALDYQENYYSDITMTINEYNREEYYRHDVEMTNVYYTVNGSREPLFYMHVCLKPMRLVSVPVTQDGLNQLVNITYKFTDVTVPSNVMRYSVRLLSLGNNLYRVAIYTNNPDPSYYIEYISYDTQNNVIVPNYRETYFPQRVYFCQLDWAKPLTSCLFKYNHDANGYVNLYTNEMNETVHIDEGPSIYLQNKNDRSSFYDTKYLRVKVGSFTNGLYKVGHDSSSNYYNGIFPLRRLERSRCEINSSTSIKMPPVQFINRPDIGLGLQLFDGDVDITNKIIDIDGTTGIVTLAYYPFSGFENITVTCCYLDYFVEYRGFRSSNNVDIELPINPRDGNYFTNIFNINDYGHDDGQMARTMELVGKCVVIIYLRDDGTLFHSVQHNSRINYFDPFHLCYDSIQYNAVLQPNKRSPLLPSSAAHNAIIVGVVGIPDTFSSTTIIDSRKRGGGIAGKLPDEDGMWWDRRSLDGKAYTSNGVFVVKSSQLDTYYSKIVESTEKYKSAGSLPVYIAGVEKTDSMRSYNLDTRVMYDTSTINQNQRVSLSRSNIAMIVGTSRTIAVDNSLDVPYTIGITVNGDTEYSSIMDVKFIDRRTLSIHPYEGGIHTVRIDYFDTSGNILANMRLVVEAIVEG